MESVGIIELNSIARGIEVADHLLKAADVTLIKASTICPGKYLILLRGEVGAVEASVDAGLSIGGENVVEHRVIPRLDTRVIEAINATSEVRRLKSLGVLEFFDVSTALYAADIAVKTADIELIEIRLGYAIGGKSFVTLTGELSAVDAAVEAGVEAGRGNSMLVNKSIIPSPREELLESLL